MNQAEIQRIMDIVKGVKGADAEVHIYGKMRKLQMPGNTSTTVSASSLTSQQVTQPAHITSEKGCGLTVPCVDFSVNAPSVILIQDWRKAFE